nr:translation initiation factor IF-2-like [Aegilops tauschii subsp. strangulata]
MPRVLRRRLARVPLPRPASPRPARPGLHRARAPRRPPMRPASSAVAPPPRASPRLSAASRPSAARLLAAASRARLLRRRRRTPPPSTAPAPALRLRLAAAVPQQQHASRVAGERAAAGLLVGVARECPGEAVCARGMSAARPGAREGAAMGHGEGAVNGVRARASTARGQRRRGAGDCGQAAVAEVAGNGWHRAAKAQTR